MDKKDIIETIQEKGLYDFIAINFWKLDNETKQGLAQEMAYTIYKMGQELDATKKEEEDTNEKHFTKALLEEYQDRY